MKNEMMVFEKEEFGKVRIVMQDEQPWFVAKDVAEILGYKNSSEAVRDNCKYVEILKSSSELLLDIPARGLQVIPESDLYRLIMRSQLESSEKFQDWVVEEVLPSIRKTGSYKLKKAAKETTDQPINMAPKTVKAFKAYMSLLKTLGIDKNAAAISANQACLKLTGQNTLELLGQTHLESEKQELYFTPTELGKRYGKSARELNRLLLEKGLQEKHGKTWVPTQKGLMFCKVFDTGKRHGEGTPIAQVKWAGSVFGM